MDIIFHFLMFTNNGEMKYEINWCWGENENEICIFDSPESLDK